VNNRTQKISIKYKESEEFIINGIPDKKIAEILIPMVENFDTRNISLDLFNNSLISSLLISPILFGETKPEIISNGFRYDGLSFL
jgi:hypothetical protein